MSLNYTRLDKVFEAAWWSGLTLTTILSFFATITSSTVLAACALGVVLISAAISVIGVRISRQRRATKRRPASQHGEPTP